MRVVYLNKVRMDTNIPAVNFSLLNGYGLALGGAECILITQKKDPHFTTTSLFANFELEKLPHFQVIMLPRTARFGIRTNQWFYLEAFRQIRQLHQHRPLDAVISRDPGALPYLAWLKFHTQIPVFYQPHNFYLDLSIRPDLKPANAKKYRWLERTFIPRMTGVLCLQEAQAQWYQKYFPNHAITVAKPGLLRIKPPQFDRFRHKLIGYVGSLEWKKGVEFLFEAFRLLEDPDLKLVLIGGRDDREIAPIQHHITVAGWQDRIHITGWIPPVEVDHWLEKVAIGVIPLKNVFYNRYLTAPNKLFDYLSHGIPIVTADLPAIRNFLPDERAAQFFTPENPAEMAQGIRHILKTNAVYRQFTHAALQQADAYLWQKRGKLMLAEIHRLCHPAKG